MPSSYTSRLRLEEQVSGENDTTWGTRLNTVIELLDDAIAGMATINTTGGTSVLTTNNSTADEARMAILKITGTLVSNATIQIPALTKRYIVWNATSGSFSVTVKTSGGSGKVVAQGKMTDLFCDGTDVYVSYQDMSVLSGETPTFAGMVLTALLAITSSAFNPSANANGALQLNGSFGGGIILKDTAFIAMWSSGSGTILNFGLNGGGGGFPSTHMQLTTTDLFINGVSALKWQGSDKTVSTSGPSGGADGDIWFEREA